MLVVLGCKGGDLSAAIFQVMVLWAKIWLEGAVLSTLAA
ncbi:hypothetical protein SMB34_16680 [Thalassospira permensis NBRC 106175]|uniref:Uncharacterized protein n=1 Tax=Thalassospira permensis NBRC 106175 TaxID=1353532 RepID=A0ABR4TP58_9PROT|nr:hypothetical protein SMB34_16680 [Thalassospira permensis NBRC 106175]